MKDFDVEEYYLLDDVREVHMVDIRTSFHKEHQWSTKPHDAIVMESDELDST